MNAINYTIKQVLKSFKKGDLVAILIPNKIKDANTFVVKVGILEKKIV